MRIGIGLGFSLLILAGCNFEREEDPKPTTRPERSPVAWATAWTATSTPNASATPLPSATNAPTLTNVPTIVAVAPTLSDTPAPPAKTLLPTLTKAPSATPTIVTATPAPTLTPLPSATYQPPTQTTVPATNTPQQAVEPTITETSSLRTYAPPPSFTPQPSRTPIPPSVTPIPQAKVCGDCGGLRLRSGPGTSSEVLGELSALEPLQIIGRTADNSWVQVVLADGRTGWVSSSYLDLNIDLGIVSVTGNVPTPAPTTLANAAGFDPATLISGISSNARAIFLDGLVKGNSPHTFTRVGDSITAAPQFLTQIGQGTYQLNTYGYLQTAINFFSGPNGRNENPFAAGSIAAHNSWGADSVLNPSLADSGRCRSGETPLVCEYRTAKPSVALIMVGTNDSGGIPAATFQANLQRIVQISIDMGVIPVLSTIPPKQYNLATDGRVQEFNQIIIATARSYDVPLWDFYSAMSATPGDGLHSDGVHPSTPPDGITTIFDMNHLQYGYTVRNLTALQTLHSLWQYVLYDGDQLLASGIPDTSSSFGTTGTAGATNSTAGTTGTTYSCPGTAMVPLVVGGHGQVTPGLPNKMRTAPSTSAEQVGSIPGEAVFDVIDGPRCADGYNWWKVSYDGLVGWTADGAPDDPWLQP